MRKELTIAELEGERTDLLPARETLSYGGNNNWATIVASNSSLALNAASLFASANSAAVQTIVVNQG
jgi:hypothetical protein